MTKNEPKYYNNKNQNIRSECVHASFIRFRKPLNDEMGKVWRQSVFIPAPSPQFGVYAKPPLLPPSNFWLITHQVELPRPTHAFYPEYNFIELLEFASFGEGKDASYLGMG